MSNPFDSLLSFHFLYSLSSLIPLFLSLSPSLSPSPFLSPFLFLSPSFFLYLCLRVCLCVCLWSHPLRISPVGTNNSKHSKYSTHIKATILMDSLLAKGQGKDFVFLLLLGSMDCYGRLGSSPILMLRPIMGLSVCLNCGICCELTQSGGRSGKNQAEMCTQSQGFCSANVKNLEPYFHQISLFSFR